MNTQIGPVVPLPPEVEASLLKAEKGQEYILVLRVPNSCDPGDLQQALARLRKSLGKRFFVMALPEDVRLELYPTPSHATSAPQVKRPKAPWDF